MVFKSNGDVDIREVGTPLEFHQTGNLVKPRIWNGEWTSGELCAI